jgi:glycosyltransferase involved in cell wall biosynthesis
MRDVISQASVYLSTAKETFGIGILEALACGVPVLAVDHGNARMLVSHRETGYLVRPDDEDDLLAGLNFCLTQRASLSADCRAAAERYTWPHVAASLADIYKQSVATHHRPHDVAVVIPLYNKYPTLRRCVQSVFRQTLMPTEIVIVDNNSTDDSYRAAQDLAHEYPDRVRVMQEPRQGVAHARNAGVASVETRYVCCLDADDEILPEFLATCVNTLQQAPHLGLAYTRLEGVHPDGTVQRSDWPGEYNFAGFLERRNQVPTCCVFRRDLWQRLGGYRQRYAPRGAGSEDAEFWLRMGAIGYPGQLTGDVPLFRYHFGGSTSQPGYAEPDWHYWHPWTKDKQYPFAAALKPGIHPVRSYSDPRIAVCIPCASHHFPLLWDALDSIEGQSFRAWEIAVAVDLQGDEPAVRLDELARLTAAYPHVRFVTVHQAGAGAARNAAAAATHAPYLLWLDADDRLELECLDILWKEHELTPHEILYSDYTARMYVHDPKGPSIADRLLHYDKEDGFALIAFRAAEYDCERALRQPEEPFYQWNLVSSLVSRTAHNAVGGFDPLMESWEDWDYWLRLARAGLCFRRVAKRLFSYGFQTGSRREIGRNQDQKLLDYLRDKYERTENMAKGCSGCGRRSSSVSAAPSFTGRNLMANKPQMSPRAVDMVRVEYIEKVPTGKSVSVRDQETQELHNYGFRRQGETFLMQRRHADAWPTRFHVLEAAPEAQESPSSFASHSEPKGKNEAQERGEGKKPSKPADPDLERGGPQSGGSGRTEDRPPGLENDVEFEQAEPKRGTKRKS